MGNSAPLFSRKRNDWGTPNDLFNQLNDEFRFDCDVAASSLNTKCGLFIDEETNSLVTPWSKSNWCNPPYSNTEAFVQKAIKEQGLGNLTVMLIPARTDTKLFHNYIYDKSDIEIRFIKGRVKFIHPDGGLLRGTSMNGSNNSAPFPSMVVIFRPTPKAKESEGSDGK